MRKVGHLVTKNFEENLNLKKFASKSVLLPFIFTRMQYLFVEHRTGTLICDKLKDNYIASHKKDFIYSVNS